MDTNDDVTKTVCTAMIQPQGLSTEDMLRDLTEQTQILSTNLTQHVQSTTSSIKNLEKKVGQLADSFSKMEQRQSNGLPSQTEVNPREHVSAIHLRSGRRLEGSSEAEKMVEIGRASCRERV